MTHETFRDSRNAGSSSKNCSPAFCAGEIGDGSGCGRGFQQVVCQPLEAGLAVQRCRGTLSQAASWPQPETETPPAPPTLGRVEAGHAPLGLCACRLDRSVSARHDPTVVRRPVPRELHWDDPTPTRLDSAEARAPSARTQRTGDRPLAPRRVAAAKKRARNGKLASFFSTKVASCCSPCDAGFGLRAGRRPWSTPGIAMTESRRWRHCLALPGPNASVCTTTCCVIMLARTTWSGSCERPTLTSVVRCCWCVIICPLIARLCAGCEKPDARGSTWRGSPRTLPTSIPSRTSGVSRSTVTSPTSFPMTSPNSKTLSMPSSSSTAVTPADFTHAFTRWTSFYNRLFHYLPETQ
jgi:hypothetical protein